MPKNHILSKSKFTSSKLLVSKQRFGQNKREFCIFPFTLSKKEDFNTKEQKITCNFLFKAL